MRQNHQQAFENDFHTLATTDDTDIIFYCTIGYRSGMEAARICDEYNIDRGRVYSLDGIVPYTHALKSHRPGPPGGTICFVVFGNEFKMYSN